MQNLACLIKNSNDEIMKKSKSPTSWFPQKQSPKKIKNFKHRVTIRHSNSTTRYITKRNKDLHPYRDLYLNVHSNLIYNNHKLEVTHWPLAGEYINAL